MFAGLPFSALRINLKIHSQKIKKMKKLLFVLALGAFAACGNGETEVVDEDTMTVEEEIMPVDTMTVPVDTMGVDTTTL